MSKTKIILVSGSLISLIVAFLVFGHAKAQKVSNHSEGGKKIILMQHPNWKLGDWFEILCEDSDGQHHPITIIRRYQFVKSSSLLGIKCIELYQIPHAKVNIAHSDMLTEDTDERIYYIQKSNMNLAAIGWHKQVASTGIDELVVDTLGSPVDIEDYLIGLFPAFPLVSGTTKRVDAKLI